TYASGNQNWFPGLNEFGEDERITVEQRFQILMDEDYITPEYAISPSETEMIMAWEGGGRVHEDKAPVTKANYSYAMLQIPARADAVQNGPRHLTAKPSFFQTGTWERRANH
ncbi:MAG: hypothetical protein AAGB26_13015, partial [Planctomycetota bacterium]